MNIPFLDLKQSYNNIKDEINNSIQCVLDKGNYILGEEVIKFENNFAKYCGINHFIGLANGTDALDIALQALELDNESEIIVQGNTYIATCLGVIHNNYKLVLCDCDENTYQISIDDMENKITNKTKVLILVHLYGLVSNMDEIINFCTRHNLILIEDVAQAHGAEWKEKKVGSFGLMSCFSFYPGKNLGAYGDAGGIGTNNNELNNKIRMIRNNGSIIKYQHDIIGRNSRLDTIQASILNVKLKYLDENNIKRKYNAELYNKYLDKLYIKTPFIIENSNPVYHLFVIRAKYRDELQNYLKDKGIETLIHYPIPCGETIALKNINIISPINCINISKEIVSLPMYPELNEEQIKYICTNINNFYNYKDNIIYRFDTKKVEKKDGILHCINDMNFNTKRIFYIDNFELNNNTRGLHANISCSEFIFIISGSINITITNRLEEKNTVILEKNEGILIKPMNWLEFNALTANTIIIVLCDEPFIYDKNKSIFNYNDFINYKNI